MKKILKAALTGELGINLIQKIVLEMGCMWYPTGGTEAGIDGTIEILDPITSEATPVSWNLSGSHAQEHIEHIAQAVIVGKKAQRSTLGSASPTDRSPHF